MRPDVIAAAVAATKLKRYVPHSVCLTCVRHVYPEQHKPAYPNHLVETLSAAEGDEVARVHKAADDADHERAKAFVAQLKQRKGGQDSV